MNTTETLTLTRIIAATCPGQRIDEYTPDAWAPLLDDLDFADARAAVTNLGRRQAFISPADIRGEVARIRAARLEAEPEPVPDADPGDPAAYLAALRRQRRCIAAGGQVTGRAATGPRRPVGALVARAAHRRATPRTTP